MQLASRVQQGKRARPKSHRLVIFFHPPERKGVRVNVADTAVSRRAFAFLFYAFFCRVFLPINRHLAIFKYKSMERPDLYCLVAVKHHADPRQEIGTLRHPKDVIFMSHNGTEWNQQDAPYICHETLKRGMTLWTLDGWQREATHMDHVKQTIPNVDAKRYRHFECFRLDASTTLPACLQCTPFSADQWILSWNSSTPKQLVEHVTCTHVWFSAVLPEMRDLPWTSQGTVWVPRRRYSVRGVSSQVSTVLDGLSLVVDSSDDFCAVAPASTLFQDLESTQSLTDLTPRQIVDCLEWMKDMICWSPYAEDIGLAAQVRVVLQARKKI